MTGVKEKKSAKIPVFENRTKIDQIVYDESCSAITIRPRGTIRGEWYARHAGKAGPLRLVENAMDVEVPDVKTLTKGATNGKDKKSVDSAGAA